MENMSYLKCIQFTYGVLLTYVAITEAISTHVKDKIETIELGVSFVPPTLRSPVAFPLGSRLIEFARALYCVC